ncbi:hypothetical protein TNCV_1916691 [Trichonephila clavipes]|uniref:Uncharacterized protein n=1 Tax=Trichonephila clavipes TaxID=2585209 RepID=A0A8X6W0R3_TRICX|nr:hypothetical protein TNCV_1916691 [Trichonephila clavipes]
MKTSSVEFIFRSPTPSPMERKYRRFVLLRRIFQPWQNEGKREIVLNRRPGLLSMRSTKDQLVKKDVFMPVKHNVFPVEPSGCRRGAFMMEKLSSSKKL